MKLSTRGRYGTRILLDIALNQGEEAVRLADVAKRQAIPLPYLRRLIAPLVRTGLLRTMRGTGGGASLARHPQQIRMREVIECLEGTVSLVECVGNPAFCERSERCASRDLWSEIEKETNKILESTSLQDLVERQKQKGSPEGMYYI